MQNLGSVSMGGFTNGGLQMGSTNNLNAASVAKNVVKGAGWIAQTFCEGPMWMGVGRCGKEIEIPTNAPVWVKKTGGKIKFVSQILCEAAMGAGSCGPEQPWNLPADKKAIIILI